MTVTQYDARLRGMLKSLAVDAYIDVPWNWHTRARALAEEMGYKLVPRRVIERGEVFERFWRIG